MDSETRALLQILDDRTRRIQTDTGIIRSQLNSLKVKVATLAGIVATIVAFLVK